MFFLQRFCTLFQLKLCFKQHKIVLWFYLYVNYNNPDVYPLLTITNKNSITFALLTICHWQYYCFPEITQPALIDLSNIKSMVYWSNMDTIYYFPAILWWGVSLWQVVIKKHLLIRDFTVNH